MGHFMSLFGRDTFRNLLPKRERSAVTEPHLRAKAIGVRVAGHAPVASW